MIINNDSLHALKELDDNSIDAVITDPPYGYSFMGKDWDKAVPSVEIWRECLRVLKPGGWCLVMSAPRSDVQNAMISRLMEAGFRLDFTPIYWTYASGFPKAGNVGKLVDKRLGTYVEGKPTANARFHSGGDEGNYNHAKITREFTAQSPQAKALDGSYTGFQPKPAVEVIIVAMKPLSEKTYVDQALKNGKGITWLDDCRIGTGDGTTKTVNYPDIRGDNYAQGKGSYSEKKTVEYQVESKGRFPANLLVSDDVLNDGCVTKSGNSKANTYDKHGGQWGQGKQIRGADFGDSGSYSRYFDLDKWAAAHLSEQQMKTFPFAIFPKASKSEKNKGLEHLDEKLAGGMSGTRDGSMLTGSGNVRNNMAKNHHPTVKPLKLMSYLITLTTREGDVVLDPFVGSGTTVVAAKQLGRKGIGIEREPEYAEIAQARYDHAELKVNEPKVEQTRLV